MQRIARRFCVDAVLASLLFASSLGCGSGHADAGTGAGASSSSSTTTAATGAAGTSSTAGAGGAMSTSTSSGAGSGAGGGGGAGGAPACSTAPETPLDQLVDMAAPGFAYQKSFDQGTLGKSVQGQPDGFDDAAGDSVLTDQICYRGGRGAKLQITAADTAFGTWGGIVNTPVLHAGDEIWYRIRTFWPAGSDLTAYYNTGLPGSHQDPSQPSWPRILKFLRLHTVTPSNGNGGYDDIYISTDPSSDHALQFIYEGEQVWDLVGKVSDRIKLGTWETYEVYLKLSEKAMASGGAARVRVYKDGILLNDIQDRQTLAAADYTAQDVFVFTYWNNAAPITEAMYVDDMIVTTKTPLAKDADGFPYIGMK